MAITNNGTVNSLSDVALPSGYSRPSVTEFTDFEYTRKLTLSILKATVENATASTTMNNIINNGTVGITKQITDILAIDFISTPEVIAYAELTALSNNFVDIDGTGTVLKNTAASYVATVILYVKTIDA